MTESEKLLAQFPLFSEKNRQKVLTQFWALAAAYPEKCHHNDGYTDLWLTAIADVRDGTNIWLPS